MIFRRNVAPLQSRCSCRNRLRSSRSWLLREAGQIALVIVLAVYVINLGYGFEGTGARLDELRFISPTLRDSPGAFLPGSIPRPGNRFAGTLWGRLPIPVPANYLLGIDRQKYDFDEAGFWSYLRGHWRQGGWWYYYLYALAIKEPLGTWLLALLALAAPFAASGRTGNWQDELLVWAPAAAVLLLVSSQTGFNHPMRYVLPMFPLAAGQQHRLGPGPVAAETLADWPTSTAGRSNAGSAVRASARNGLRPASPVARLLDGTSESLGRRLVPDREA